MIFWRSIKNYRKLKEDESVDIALKQIKEKEYVQKFKNENNIKKPNANNTCRDFVNNNSVEDNFEIDEEEKIVVALAASIMAGDGIPNPNLHIKRITRIS